MKISLGRSCGQVNNGSAIPFGSRLAFVDVSGRTTVATGGSRIAIQNNIEQVSSHKLYCNWHSCS